VFLFPIPGNIDPAFGAIFPVRRDILIIRLRSREPLARDPHVVVILIFPVPGRPDLIGGRGRRWRRFLARWRRCLVHDNGVGRCLSLRRFSFNHDGLRLGGRSGLRHHDNSLTMTATGKQNAGAHCHRHQGKLYEVFHRQGGSTGFEQRTHAPPGGSRCATRSAGQQNPSILQVRSPREDRGKS
jgi:hypothetical protein